MNRTHKWLVGISASLGAVVAVAAFAASDAPPPQNNAEQHSHGGMQHGMPGGTEHGRMGMMQGQGMQGAMANATPEQRRQLAQNMHAEKHGSATGGKHQHGTTEKGPDGTKPGNQEGEHQH